MFQGLWVAGCLGIVAQCNWPMRYDSNNSDTAQSLSDAKIANFRTQQELNCVQKTKREMVSFETLLNGKIKFVLNTQQTDKQQFGGYRAATFAA